MRNFATKTELIDANGGHIRYLPGPMAKSLVDGGGAEIAHRNGKIRSVRLIASAATHAQRIGEPSDGRAFGVKFTRRTMLDGGFIVIEHHPRCRDYE